MAEDLGTWSTKISKERGDHGSHRRRRGGTGKDLVARAIHFESDAPGVAFPGALNLLVPSRSISSRTSSSATERGAFTDAREPKAQVWSRLAGPGDALPGRGSPIFPSRPRPSSSASSRTGRSRRVGGAADLKRRYSNHRGDQPETWRSGREGRGGSARTSFYPAQGSLPVHLPPLRERGRKTSSF